MAALNPKAKAVIQEAREGLRPPVGERERIEALLDARLGALAPAPRVDPVPPVRAGGWRFVPPLAIGVALVGGAAFLALRTGPVDISAPAIPSVALPVSALAPAAETSAIVPAEPAAPPEPTPVVVEPPAPPRAEDRLAQEVALLSRAMSDLRSGRASEALKLLDEHQRKFPKGVLGVERRGARAQALCSLKRVAEGRAELARLAPQSPAAGRAKQVCDAASRRAMGNSARAHRARSERTGAATARGTRPNELMPAELRELAAIRSELVERIMRKRRSICGAFEEAGVPIAGALAEASSHTIRTFLEASECATPSSESVRSLALVLGLPPFSVSVALRNDLSERQRFYLSVQLHRLDALAHALFSTEPPSFGARGLSSTRREK